MLLTIGSVTMNMVYAPMISRQARYSEDGSTYLWEDWRIEATCIYNPRATSYGVDAAFIPFAEEGRPGAETDTNIREYLMQPRRQVNITSEPDAGGTVRSLVTSPNSPGRDFTVDCNNGPKVTVLNIASPVGQFKTFEIQLVIEMAVRDELNNHVLLSHRWRQYMDADLESDYLQTITTEGECVFNLPVLTKRDLHPDTFRAALFHPVPSNFQREMVKASPGSDGITYHYVIVDQENHFNLGKNCPAIRIEVMKSAGFESPNQYEAVANLFSSVAKSVLGGARSDAEAGFLIGQARSRRERRRARSARSFGRAGIAASIGSALIGGVLGGLPIFNRSCTVRVWGDRDSNKVDLIGVGLGILAFQCPIPDGGVGWSFGITEDVTERFVEVERTVTWGRELLFDPGAGAQPAPLKIQRLFPKLAGPVGVLAAPDLEKAMTTTLSGFGNHDVSETLRNNRTDNPGLTDDAFGDSLVMLMEQALSNPLALPPSVPRTTTFQSQPLT